MASKKKVPPAKKRNRGQQPFEPTDRDRQQVRMLIGFGARHREIAFFIQNPRTGKPIDVDTLEKHFRQELDDGVAILNMKVAESLYKQALGNGKGAVTAAIWWTKCRMGWRGPERIVHEFDTNTGVLVVPAQVKAEDWIKEQQTKDAQKRKPGRQKKDA